MYYNKNDRQVHIKVRLSKTILLLFLDKFQDILELSHINKIYECEFAGEIPSDNYTPDIITYVTFRVMIQGKLENTDPNIIRDLAKISLIANSSDIITDTLLKYSSAISNNEINELKNKIGRVEGYHSLFEEDI